jgi:hypothetical protein
MRVQPKMIMTSPPRRGHRICPVHHERINTSPANRPGRRQTGRTSTNDDNMLVHYPSLARFPAAVNTTRDCPQAKSPQEPQSGYQQARSHANRPVL